VNLQFFGAHLPASGLPSSGSGRSQPTTQCSTSPRPLVGWASLPVAPTTKRGAEDIGNECGPNTPSEQCHSDRRTRLSRVRSGGIWSISASRQARATSPAARPDFSTSLVPRYGRNDNKYSYIAITRDFIKRCDASFLYRYLLILAFALAFYPLAPAMASDTSPVAATYASPPFSFTYGGKGSADLLKAWPVRSTQENLDDTRLQRTTTYTDPSTHLEVEVVSVQYTDYPTVEWTVYFKNTGKRDTPVLENIHALDTTFPRGGRPFELLHYFDGGYDGVNAYQPHEVALLKGDSSRSFSPGGRGSDRWMPYFNLESGDGGVMIAVGWPGQWQVKFSDGMSDNRRVQAGQALTHLVLHPGESVRSPLIALQYWKGGDWIDAQNTWRRWMIAHNLPRDEGRPLAPTLFAGSPNLDWNEKDILTYLSDYIAAGIRPNCLWMDAGWYTFKKDWIEVGSWRPDPLRFPNGFRAIGDFAHKNGVKTLVWFEPERVTPGTWLWVNHPEWLLGTGNVNRLLDLGNPDARKWLTDYMDEFLTEQHIDIYRQDYNINPLDFWPGRDASNRQGITEIHYIEGYLAYLDELLKRHPQLLIDSCASGGRRNDLETMRRAVPLWRCDHILDPIANQCETSGLALWIPYQGGFNVSDNQYQARSAMGWAFITCWDIKNSHFDMASLSRITNQWRRIAPCTLGDFYPLTAWSLSTKVWMAWQYNRPDSGDGIVQAFRRPGCISSSARLPLRGLDAQASYEATDLDSSRSWNMIGRELMGGGVPVNVSEAPGSALIIYRREAK